MTGEAHKLAVLSKYTKKKIKFLQKIQNILMNES
jgi:hypothetical protein